MLTEAEAHNCPCVLQQAGHIANPRIMELDTACYGYRCPKWRNAREFSCKVPGYCNNLRVWYREGRQTSEMSDMVDECVKQHNVLDCQFCPECYGYCGG